MKNIPLLFLSILIFGLLFSPGKPAQAAIQAENTTWWSVEEMIEFSRQVDAEREELCRGDQACEEDFYLSMHEKGDKYSALLNFLSSRVWLTSINPATETIKVFYFDEDMMLGNMGIEEHADLTHLYFGWFDDWSGQIYNYNYDQFTDGTMPGLHTMYVGDASEYGAGWIPTREEVELSVAGSDLIRNTSGKIDYAAFADPYFNAQGYFDVSSCLNAPDYTEGTECKLMISSDRWVSYFPPRDEIRLENEDIVDSAFNDDIQNELNGSLSQTESLENAGNEQVKNEQPATTENTIYTKDNFIKSPNTGTMTNPCPSRTIEFPWWLVILIALGDAVVLWLFWPNKSSKKSQKNS